MITPAIKAFDFFCGAGGLTRGLSDAGVSVLAGIDIDERLRQTYERNNHPSAFVSADVREIDIHELRSQHGVTAEDRVLYAACTPCQPFSTLNQRKGQDDRKQLLLAFAELLAAAPPDFVLVENVPGLGNAYGREVYESFMATLALAGFDDVASGKLDARDFAVPQVRRRFILLASRVGSIRLPTPLPGDPATVRSAIGHLPRPSPTCEVPNHIARVPSEAHLRILRAVPHDGGSRRDVEDTSILLACHQRNPDVHKDVFGRMAWSAPAPTLTARCTDVYCGRFTHPDQDRGLTLREAAALQSFPDDYVFDGSFFHIAGQIGNAVPVRFAQALGAAVIAAAGAS